MRALILAAAACALLAPSVTKAQLVLGGQAGVGFPVGDVEQDAPFKEAVAHAFPVELRAMWHLSPELSGGLQGGFGYATAADERDGLCRDTGADCTQHLWRIAARGEYSFPGERVFPYLAGTLGWEWLVERWEVSSGNWEQATVGGPLVGAEAGLDIPHLERLRGGVFVGLSLGQYRSRWVKGEVPAFGEYQDAGEVADPAVHGLVTLGLRGSFSL
jgi:hypothetical protein